MADVSRVCGRGREARCVRLRRDRKASLCELLDVPQRDDAATGRMPRMLLRIGRRLHPLAIDRAAARNSRHSPAVRGRSPCGRRRVSASAQSLRSSSCLVSERPAEPSLVARRGVGGEQDGMANGLAAEPRSGRCSNRPDRADCVDGAAVDDTAPVGGRHLHVQPGLNAAPGRASARSCS